MSVGVLLITHEGIGSALIAVATQLMPALPLRIETLEVSFAADPEALREHCAHQRCVDQCSGGCLPQQRVLHIPLHMQASGSGPPDCVDYDTTGP